MKNTFYNKEQRRIRALWRILIQGGLFLLGLTLISTVLGVIAMLIMAATGQADLELLLNQEALMGALMSLGGGWFFALIGVGTVVVIVLTFLLAGWLLDRRKFTEFGFHFSRQWWLDLGFGLVLGAVLMMMIFLIELAAGWITIAGTMRTSGSSFLSGWLAMLVGFICVGIYEEMLFRGYHLRNIVEGLNWKKLGPRSALWIGYILSSSIFGLAHATNPNATWISTLNLVLAGLFLGLGFVLTGELAIPIGLHITWNFFQGNIFGFPVSGSRSGTSLISIQQGGPDLLTGGAFGPEAGLVGILAILVGSALTILYVRKTRGEVRLRTELAEYQKPVIKAAIHPEIMVNE
ncbi:MAG: CPBP family intramembrane metalloprotease domain-containing protein [Chloroflexi bacterium HGW-Chloroflexi-3]|nr:MAG: CPBP family intramembrane metalloprotease domain-containing protein [Chloroflexi bacterium HGW-Chloroflexi-3]